MDDIDTEGGRCWAGGAQDGATPLNIACLEGHEEVVKLLLADERVDVNQANKVRVGGEGEGAWREQAGRGGGWAQGVALVTAPSTTTSQHARSVQAYDYEHFNRSRDALTSLTGLHRRRMATHRSPSPVAAATPRSVSCFRWPPQVAAVRKRRERCGR